MDSRLVLILFGLLSVDVLITMPLLIVTVFNGDITITQAPHVEEYYNVSVMPCQCYICKCMYESCIHQSFLDGKCTNTRTHSKIYNCDMLGLIMAIFFYMPIAELGRLHVC